MTEEESDAVKRVHEAFRIRRENYGRMGQECRKMAEIIPNSHWKDHQAQYGIASLFSALTLVSGRFETLEELDERVLVYVVSTEDWMRKAMHLLDGMAERLDGISGEHEKLAQTKTEIEGIAKGIKEGMTRYEEVLGFLETATKKAEEEQKQLTKKAEEDRKRLEKGLSYLG